MTAPKGIHEAMLAFHANPPHIPLDGRNPGFKSKYATYLAVTNAVRPALNALGCYHSQPLTTGEDGAPAIITAIIHAPSGESIEYPTPLLLGGKSDPQAWGSAITYARRYGLLSILGLVGDEDDDGNAATAKPAPVTARADTGGGATNTAPGDEPITPVRNAELGAVVTEAVKAGVLVVEGEGGLRDEMNRRFGKTSRTALTEVEAKEIIKWVRGLKAKVGG